MTSYIKTNEYLMVMFDDGETVTVHPSNSKFTDIVNALKAKNYKKVRDLAKPETAVKKKIEVAKRHGNSNVELNNGIVFYKGVPIHNTLTTRIVEMANEGFDIEPMCKFLENLQQNPSFRAVTELYVFLEQASLPITEDGCFLAYKRVKDNYHDIYTGKIDNSIGKIVEMDRNKVDEDKNRTCSAGLHFCSRAYLSQYGVERGNRTIVVKINPADVVAIPADHNNTKGRTCRYEVTSELSHSEEEKLEGAFKPSKDYQGEYNDEDTIDEDLFDEDDLCEDCLNFIENCDCDCEVEAIEQYDLETDEVIDTFNDLIDAEADTGISVSAIRRVLNGNRKSTGGYGWRYSSEWDG